MIAMAWLAAARSIPACTATRKADALWRAKALEARIARLELEIRVQTEADAAEDRLHASGKISGRRR